MKTYTSNFVTVYCVEALEGMSLLEPQSIHCAVTSPPYFGLRSYLDKDHPDKGRELGAESSTDEYVEKLVAVFEALKPALRDDGTLFVNLGNSYAGGGKGGGGSFAQDGIRTALEGTDKNIRTRHGRRSTPTGYKPKDLIPVAWLFGIAMQRAGWWLRSDIIWSKSNPMPSSVTDRPSTSHEYILMFSKRPRYYFDMTAVKEPHAPPKHNRFSTKRVADAKDYSKNAISDAGHDYTANTAFDPASAGRNLRTVWTINSPKAKLRDDLSDEKRSYVVGELLRRRLL